MTCPTKATLTGDGRVDVGFFDTPLAATTEAFSLVQSRADVEAGLAFNGYICPDQLCQRKMLGPVTTSGVVTSASRWSLLALFASIMWAEAKYQGTAKFSWSAQVECTEAESGIIQQLIAAFSIAAAQRWTSVSTIATGWLNNILSWFGLGRGCGDWSDWILSWLYREGWGPRLARIQHCWYWVHWWFFTKHQVVLITDTDGHQYVLDPYTDPAHPVWDRDQYEREYGKLHCD